MKWSVLMLFLGGCALGDNSSWVTINVTITCTSNDGPITCPAKLPTIIDTDPMIDTTVGYEQRGNVPVVPTALSIP